MDMTREMLSWVETCFDEVAPVAFDANEKIWELAELSGAEYRSSELLMRILQENGFSVRAGVCGRPTAFIASYGQGHPVIGILGEYDALPGLSQEKGLPIPQPRPDCSNGHGCGHCALGSGSLAAVLLARRYLEENGLQGTIRYYGCCDEEVNGVKPLMARQGEFDDVDCVFAWHPGGETGVPNNTLVAMQAMRVSFTSAGERQAGGAGGDNSALSACELMNVGVNYLREHITPEARIHYAYLTEEGAGACRKRQSASMAYVVRAPRAGQVDEIVERVKRCAEGAALMTETSVEIMVQNRYADRFQNYVAARILSDAAVAVGGPKWDAADYALAREFTARYDEQQRAAMLGMIRKKYPGKPVEEVLAGPLDPDVEPFDPGICKKGYASSDVGDVGYAAPTASMRVACSALGSPAHSWFMTGMIASPIGRKGLACAAKILGLAAIRIYEAPELLDGAQEERLAKIGGLQG